MGDTTRDRLELRSRILEIIDRRREETGDRSLGSSVERLLIEEELRDLVSESTIEGEPALVPVRRYGKGRKFPRPY